jgi:FkbM family methyltransferase
LKLIRKLIIKLFGIKRYLQWVSFIYIKLISLGFSKSKYAELFFTQEIIKENDNVLDIGANLAYYSYFFRKKIGTNGKLFAIEPIPLFADVWRKNMKKFDNKNIKLFNCALGSESQAEVNMSIPIVDGVVRHGLTKVDGQGEEGWGRLLEYRVPMYVGDDLMQKENITKLNYIKCDVEGYEQYVIPSLSQTIDKFKPTVQIELNGEENRNNVTDFFKNKKYDVYVLQQNILNIIDFDKVNDYNQDFYFIHRDKVQNYSKLINN